MEMFLHHHDGVWDEKASEMSIESKNLYVQWSGVNPPKYLADPLHAMGQVEHGRPQQWGGKSDYTPLPANLTKKPKLTATTEPEDPDE